jgi:tetratricopeptide (TPR) repeat protein
MTIGRTRVATRLLNRAARPVFAGAVGCAIVFFAGCSDRQPESPQVKTPIAQEPAPTVSDDLSRALSDFNRAAALLEQYEYSKAAETLEGVLKIAPTWQAARFNLGLAYLNMLGVRGAQDYLAAARSTFEAVLAADPNHLPAHFCLGLLHQHLGEDEEAAAHFRVVYEADGDDPYAAYKYAETLISLQRYEEGTQLLEKVVQLDGGFISALYRLGMQYKRMRRQEEALPLLERFKELNDAELTGGSFTVRKVYGTAGKYGFALGADNLPLDPPQTRSARILFSPEPKGLGATLKTWKTPGGSANLPGVAVADVDADGDLDLCLTGVGEASDTSIWKNDGAGRFTASEPVAQRGVSPCFGDVDNDGDVDLWLGRSGGDLLLENDGQGNFTPLDAPTVTGDDLLTTAARLADVDSDGDLDLLAFRLSAGSVPVTGDATPSVASIYGNNRDGTFDDVASRLGLLLEDTPVAAAVYDDFDNDRDLDLFVFPAGAGQPVAWVNDRVWKYRTLPSEATHLAPAGVLGAASGDPNKDGNRDLLLFTSRGAELYLSDGRWRFQPDESFGKQFQNVGATGGQFADMDNDGDLDLLMADANRIDGTRGPMLLINDWPQQRFLDAAAVDPGNLLTAVKTPSAASLVAADFTGDGRVDILLAPCDGEPLLIENVTPGGHWVQLDLRGTRQQDGKSRSNGSAIGARVEVKTGAMYQQFVVGIPSGPVAMPPLRIHAGLGDLQKIDWLRIFWPDGVLQAELELAGNQVTTVEEIPRKVSSCPHLFAYNGSHFEFVCDFGGVGGLGYLSAPGMYAPPDPTEYVPIPRLEPLDGQYAVSILEPLEEVVYFDQASLIAVDHPEGTQVWPHEMMAVEASPPPFEVFCIDNPIAPLSAVDHRGVDVTAQLQQVDRRYAGATDLDPRFVGFAHDHFVQLDFGDRLQNLSPSSRLVLFLYGWVEYPYSSTNFAAAQAGLRGKAPSLHVERDGRWVELFHEVGYPAGLEHMMTLDVTGALRPGDRKIRLSSNMEIYWDRIFLAQHLDHARLALKEVSASSAELRFFGYPREYSPDGHHPNLYDYANVDRAVAWKLMDGDYTRFGDVAELLHEADDCYAIMGRGEEISLRFPVDAFGPVPEGFCRSFILKTDSFCKDMDLLTAYPDSVDPLPFHAMSGYPYGAGEQYPQTEKAKDYRRRFNTRQVRSR